MEKNFYCCKKTTDDKPNKCHHIGKSSCGWAFCFQAGNTPWGDSIDLLKNYLKEPDTEIFDESNNKYTYYKFWDEISDSLYPDEKHWDLETYWKHNPEEFELGVTGDYEYIKDAVRWSKKDFS